MKRTIKLIMIALINIVVAAGCIMGCGNKERVEDSNANNMDVHEVSEIAVELRASIADVYGNANAMVTIVSDDGVYESCVNLNKILKQRGLKGTVAGAIFIVEPYKEEWNELLKDGAIDLISHSYNHIRMEDGTEIARNVDSLKYEIVDADKWYENWLGYEQITFVCPENQMCENGYEILEENGFWSVRRGKRGYNSLSPEEGRGEGQWYNLMVQGIGDEGVDLNVRNGWVDTAIDNGTWLIEMWHNVMPEDDGAYQTILIPEAEKHLDYLVKKSLSQDIWVATYTEAVKYIREKQNAEVKAYIEENKLHVYIGLTNNQMSYDTFNQPLTVVVDMIDGYYVEENQNISFFGDKLLVDVIPGQEMIIDLTGEE